MRAASFISKASRAGSTSLSARRKRTTAWCRSPPWSAPAKTRSTARELPIPKSWPTAFRLAPEDLFAYQGLIIGSVEAGYFTPAQQELIREFVDRRGGGLLLLGGQFSLADGGWNASHADRPVADRRCRLRRAHFIARPIPGTAPRIPLPSSRPLAWIASSRAWSTTPPRTPPSGRSCPT